MHMTSATTMALSIGLDDPNMAARHLVARHLTSHLIQKWRHCLYLGQIYPYCRVFENEKRDRNAAPEKKETHHQIQQLKLKLEASRITHWPNGKWSSSSGMR
jgi:hypothetical protein